MSVDPADDCTFWYTNEYFLPNSSGGVGWNTRIASLKYPTCGQNLTSTTTTLSASANPTSYGQSVTFTATVSTSAATGSVQFFGRQHLALRNKNSERGSAASLSTSRLTGG